MLIVVCIAAGSGTKKLMLYCIWKYHSTYSKPNWQC